jgi:hypothetical protein
MSYIDQFAHQAVALFGGIPIYRPLEPIPGGTDPYDFRCGVDQLVVGGGVGEFPGIVLTDPAGAAADFAQAEAALFADDNPLKPIWQEVAGAFAGRQTLDFAGWRRSDIERFARDCAKSLPLPRPYSPVHDGDFAPWLSRCLGEFIVYSMPEIARPVTAQLPVLPQPQGFAPVHLSYGNVLLRPPHRPLLVTTAPFEDDPRWSVERPGAPDPRVGENAWEIAPFVHDPAAPPAARVFQRFDSAAASDDADR